MLSNENLILKSMVDDKGPSNSPRRAGRLATGNIDSIISDPFDELIPAITVEPVTPEIVYSAVADSRLRETPLEGEAKAK